MAYRLEKNPINGETELVIDGFENGIADDPYSGISDMRNLNTISVPKEASVLFATQKISAPSYTNLSVISADASTDVLTLSAGSQIETGQAIVFSASTISGVSTNTIYWVNKISTNTMQLYTDFTFTPVADVMSDGTGTFSTVNIDNPKYFTFDTQLNGYWLIDQSGRVWTNFRTTGNNSYWTYSGNRVPSSSFTNGNGIGFYRSANDGATGTSASPGYIFVFHNSSIDYLKLDTALSWTYQWDPSTGTAAGYNATPTRILKSSLTAQTIHYTLVPSDNRFYFTDTSWVGTFYQTDRTVAFDPTSTATYTYDETPVLPFTDTGQCLAFLGSNLLIGGMRNVIYTWDRFSTNPGLPILLSEFNVQQMVTVNTNTFIFVGNRGRVYITNGSQAQFYKKLPDHLSGTVEPYYVWGGACSNKNQLYFSALVKNNAGTNLNVMGGVWAIDLDTKAQRMTNILSYGTYAGYAPAIIPNFSSTAAGAGLYIGWNDGNSGYGIDQTISTPYTGSQAYFDSDLIPAGTFLNHKTFKHVEFKLSVPMVSGESVSMQYRVIFNGGYETIFTDSTTGDFSGLSSVNFQDVQWVQLRTILNSTASSPSYTRLKQVRLS